ncbi:MAG: M67 family metallopeptidase [Thermodesulfovibrionales bacterium]
METLSLPEELYSRMLGHFLSAYPNEACGIISSADDAGPEFHPMTNIEPTPVSYLMDPAEQFRLQKELREKGRRMLAICHSHPASPAFPSGKDVSLAFYDDAVYLIVSLLDRDRPECRAFEITGGAVREVGLVIAVRS